MYLPKDILNGIKILDFTRHLPGPLASLFLADLGAEVIVVENPKSKAIFPEELKQMLYRNKKVRKINYRTLEGKQQILELVETSDVIIESFRPYVMKELGLDYGNIKKINPEIIYCSITGFGVNNKMENTAGHNLNFLALSGLLEQNGNSEELVIPPIQLADNIGGTQTALSSILAAIIRKLRTNKGSHIVVNMTVSTLLNAVMLMYSYKIYGELLPRGKDLLTGGQACINIYKTKDNKFVALSALEPKFWVEFCNVLQKPEWIPKQFLPLPEAEVFIQEVRELFRTKTQQEWIELFKNSDCTFSPVLTLPEALKLWEIDVNKFPYFSTVKQ